MYKRQVVYTFLLLHEITGEEKYLSYAEKHFAVIKKYFSQDVNYDLLSGNAGAAIAALKLYQIKKESAESADQYLKEAVEIEKNLWNRRQTMEKGCGWKLSCAETVSYTHLDVYKRQGVKNAVADFWRSEP